MIKKSFASDNYSGIHPKILQAIQDANVGHVTSYGGDEYTHAAKEAFQKQFGENIEVYFVVNGTAANVLSLQSAMRSYHSIICAQTSHMNVDECGAPEKFLGSKLILIPTSNGKISVEKISHCLGDIGDQHRSQPKAISITQPTEMGTLYSCEEIKEIAEFSHKHGMILHMDGARLSNAAVAMGQELREISGDVGVDVLSFGGTKNGLMLGEAIVFFNAEIAKDFQYLRKQSMQLVSKMRFISAQFLAYLEQQIWKQNAQQANMMAQILAQRVKQVPGINLTQHPQTNAVFASLPKEWINSLQQKFFFYIWNPQISEVRWMCSFDTQEQDIEDFVSCLRSLMT